MAKVIVNDTEFETEFLTQEQLDKALEIIRATGEDDEINLIDVTRTVTGNPEMTGRNKEGREIKRLFELLGISTISTHDVNRRSYQLTEEHKKTIDANLNRFNRHMDLVKMVFNDDSLTNLHAESRAVLNYIKDKHKCKVGYDRVELEEKMPDGPYKPPTTPLMAFRETKKYVRSFDLDESKIENSKILHMMTKLRDYLHDSHFLMCVNNSYTDKSRRELFVSTFIKYVYDKPDLTEEEKEQYLSLAMEAVTSNDLLEQMSRLREQLADLSTSEDNNGNYRMGFVEMIDKVQKSYDASRKRETALLKSLTTSRAEKQKNRKEETMSLVQLVNYVRDEENRLRLIKVAKARQEEVKKGYKRLSDVDSLVAEIWGAGSEQDIISG